MFGDLVGTVADVTTCKFPSISVVSIFLPILIWFELVATTFEPIDVAKLNPFEIPLFAPSVEQLLNEVELDSW